MGEQNFGEMSSKAAQACSMTLEKAREALGLTSDANRDIAGRTVELGVAIAREGVQYLGDVGAALRQASEATRELWTRQRDLAQEFSRDPMGFPEKAIALSWEGGEKIARLGDAHREAIARFAGKVQNLLDRAGRETHESVSTYAGKMLMLCRPKN
jgi:hypothetical protein